MYKTKIDLSEKVRRNVIVILNDRLANAIDLQSQVKQAHWNVKGPNFIALHELFDKISDVVLEQIDEIAERVTSLGGTAEGTVAVAAKRSKLKNYPLSITAGKDHLFYLSTQIVGITARWCARRSPTPTSWAMRIRRIYSPEFPAMSTSTSGSSRRICRRRPDVMTDPAPAADNSGLRRGARHAAGTVDEPARPWKRGRRSIVCMR